MFVKPFILLAISLVFMQPLMALTFLLDTHDSIERIAMESDQIIRHTAIETGMMDVLFDEGHIFSNLQTVLSKNDREEQEKFVMQLARNEKVDYLIRLIPDEEGFNWEFYEPVSADLISQGRTDRGIVNPKSFDLSRDYWITLGGTVARNFLEKIGDLQS